MPKYHPRSEQVVDLLVTKTMSDNKHFYRILTAYYMSKMASSMRVNINTKERGIIPVNTYAINLMSSGAGKGYSTNILEENLLSGFQHEFMTNIFPAISERNMAVIAEHRSIRDGHDDEKSWHEALRKEFRELGVLPFSFDSATGPAIKQLRQKLLLAKCGSMNVEIDEIGHNLLGNTEAITVLFELFDKGLVKQKLIKNTKENVRTEEVEGYTPTNLMMFGNPAKLLDGGKTEEEFFELMMSGYARRLLFGYSPKPAVKQKLTSSEIYDRLTDKSVSSTEESLYKYFKSLANKNSYGGLLDVSKEVTIQMIDYQLDCEARAAKMNEFQEIEKAEMTHRYFKMLKQAGAYAFADKQNHISAANLQYAINLVEDSGLDFAKLVKREGAYVRLANYIASIGKDVTEVDLVESLPFYRGAKDVKASMMTLATTWGYRNNVIIKREIVDGIEFFSGESLTETNLDELILSHSTDITEGYKNELAPFDKLSSLCLLPNHHFVAHHLVDGYRDDAHISKETGFNMVVIDVDGGTQIHEATSLLECFTYFIYPTKRSTIRKNRFRLILPLSHIIHLSSKDYKTFMRAIFEWLPFDCDDQTIDRPRKWLTNASTGSYINTGKLLDAARFIPKTDKAIKEKMFIDSHTDMAPLEKWFMRKAGTGNRNTTLLRYGLAMMDAGNQADAAMLHVYEFNDKLSEPLDRDELMRTIQQTLRKKEESND